ncbi:MAG: DUF503 domain-containing protein [Sandaracinaceae bacterium]|nr:DUF503 domain-containing protein [Sandaracinaceae bacterium]
MVVGTARLVFAIPSASSLKDKRSVVRRVIERARARFDAAVAEVEDQDVHRRAVIGVAVVSSDARHATSMLDTIIASMAASTDAQMVSRKTSVQRLGEHDFDPRLGADLAADAIRLPGERDPWDDEDSDDR